MWDCPRPLVTGRGTGGSSPTPLPCPGAVLERYEPLVSDIRLWSKSILGHLGALRSVLEGVLPRQRALSDLHSKGGKTRAERHGVTDGDEERRGESRNQSILAPEIAGQKTLVHRICRPALHGMTGSLRACCGPKSAALEPISRSSESLFKPLELERAPEESLARRGMERHDVAGPPVTAARVPS